MQYGHVWIIIPRFFSSPESLEWRAKTMGKPAKSSSNRWEEPVTAIVLKWSNVSILGEMEVTLGENDWYKKYQEIFVRQL